MSSALPVSTGVELGIDGKEAWVAALKQVFGDDNVIVYDEVRQDLRAYDGGVMAGDIEISNRVGGYRKRISGTPTGHCSNLVIDSTTGVMNVDDLQANNFLRKAREAVGLEAPVGQRKTQAAEALSKVLSGVAVGHQHIRKLKRKGLRPRLNLAAGRVEVTWNPR